MAERENDTKMEIALNVSRVEFLKYLHPQAQNKGSGRGRRPTIRETELELYYSWERRLRAMFPDFSFNRIYLGAEFCERLMPSEAKVHEVIAMCDPLGIGISLVTPFVTHIGIKRVKQLICIMEEYAKLKGIKQEIIVNDFGVMHILQEYRECLTPVLGRCLHKIKRDPRIESLMNKVRDRMHHLNMPELVGLLRTIRCSGLTTGPYQSILKKLGCVRVELDPLEQGYGMNVEDQGFSASLHLPYQYITAGRYCLMGSLSLPPKEKFTMGRPCQRECSRVVTRLEHEQVHRQVYRRGNVVYAAFPDFDLEEAIIDTGISRIVLAPGIPA